MNEKVRFTTRATNELDATTEARSSGSSLRIVVERCIGEWTDRRCEVILYCERRQFRRPYWFSLSISLYDHIAQLMSRQMRLCSISCRVSQCSARQCVLIREYVLSRSVVPCSWLDLCKLFDFCELMVADAALADGDALGDGR